MIPSKNTILSTNLTVETQPSKNYKLHAELDIINGTCDNLEAMHQVIYKILNTERYQNIIYSWNYGIELVDLYGEPVAFVCSEIQRRITEALIPDDRIKSVDDFDFDLSERKTVKVTFIVHTIFGELQEEKVVNF
jgi:hypothetical protein